jgi:SAM-dependent methyltransferase
LGCGTGQIAAAIDQMGYRVTACDFAEDMIDIARRHHAGTAVKWVCLKPDWKVLPFENGSFDGIVASSVFEYLVDVRSVAAELSRVLRAGGVLLLTVPNPFNPVRRIEGLLQSVLSRQRRWLLQRVQRIHSYALYLQLSRNRFEGHVWQSMLGGAHFAAVDDADFSDQAWRRRLGAPLILLAVKKIATRPPRPVEAQHLSELPLLGCLHQTIEFVRPEATL